MEEASAPLTTTTTTIPLNEKEEEEKHEQSFKTSQISKKKKFRGPLGSVEDALIRPSRMLCITSYLGPLLWNDDCIREEISLQNGKKQKCTVICFLFFTVVFFLYCVDDFFWNRKE